MKRQGKIIAASVRTVARLGRCAASAFGRESALIRELGLTSQLVNIHRDAALETRALPPALVRDVIVVVPSVEEDSVELVGARAAGEWTIQRTRRNGADLAVHARRLLRFFNARVRRSLRRGMSESSATRRDSLIS